MGRENLDLIWNKVKTPNPKYVKDFKRSGGFNGSATNTQYIIQQATEMWGPNGRGWGVEVTKESYVDGAPLKDVDGREIIHIVKGYVWYMEEGEKCQTSEQYGQTTFVGQNKYGSFTDEEAPKKSVTDMMLKCLSLLGFSADIFLGLWDDNKYVNDVREKYLDDKSGQQPPPKTTTLAADDWEQRIDAEIKSGVITDNATFMKWRTDNAASIRSSLSAAEQKKFKTYLTGLEQDFPKQIICPENGKEVNPAECAKSKCREGCPAYDGVAA